MTEKEILRYLYLVDRKLTIYVNSGINWNPAYEKELASIDKELEQLRILVDAEHSKWEVTLEEGETPQEFFNELDREFRLEYLEKHKLVCDGCKNNDGDCMHCMRAYSDCYEN